MIDTNDTVGTTITGMYTEIINGVRTQRLPPAHIFIVMPSWLSQNMAVHHGPTNMSMSLFF